MQKIIIDTDIGGDIDDALAVAFAVLREELDVKAITTVTGPTEQRAQIAQKLLRVMGREDIPIAAGMRLPLRGLSPEQRERINNQNVNQYPFVKSKEMETYSTRSDAVNLLIETVEKYQGEIALVTIGPLTNVAVALQREPSIAQKVQWIAMMGGETYLNRREYNVASDPHAAEVVFTSGAKMFLGALEITRRVVLMPEHCDILKKRGTPLCDALSELINLWWPYKGEKPGPVLYDISPIVWSFNRSYFTTKPMQVHTETKGEFSFGMTIPQERNPNMEVTVDMLADDVLELFMDTVCQ